jgi:hypothetical protein
MKTENLDLVKLFEYVLEQPLGTELSFLQIEHDTGVVMDSAGKGLIRRAVKEAEMRYKPARGKGIWLLSPVNATDIVTSKAKRMRRAAIEVRDTITVIHKRVYHLLPKQEQQLMELRENLVNAMLSQENQIRVYSPPRKQIENVATRSTLS